MLAEVHAVEHQRDQVQPCERGGEQLAERGLGRLDEAPADRRLARRRRLSLDLFADRLQPGAHAAATSASIIATITCSPVPTAIASRPSRMSAMTSPNAMLTASGTARSV